MTPREAPDITGRLWFNTAEAAAYTGLHPDTIRHALQTGELHGGQRRRKGRWSIRRECLDAWLHEELCVHKRALRSVS